MVRVWKNGRGILRIYKITGGELFRSETMKEEEWMGLKKTEEELSGSEKWRKRNGSGLKEWRKRNCPDLKECQKENYQGLKTRGEFSGSEKWGLGNFPDLKQWRKKNGPGLKNDGSGIVRVWNMTVGYRPGLKNDERGIVQVCKKTKGESSGSEKWREVNHPGLQNDGKKIVRVWKMTWYELTRSKKWREGDCPSLQNRHCLLVVFVLVIISVAIQFNQILLVIPFSLLFRLHECRRNVVVFFVANSRK